MGAKDGGPAFPVVAIETNEHGIVFPFIQPGMSLRDWFAGQALTGLLADDSTGASYTADAVGAYKHADAMLAAREAT